MFEEGQKNNTNKSGLIYAIVGVAVLIVAVAGSAYAYYSATAADKDTVKGTAGGGAAPILVVAKDSATGPRGEMLIPIDATSLDTAAKATSKCVDKNGYTVCQIYKVTITHQTNVKTSYDISLSIPKVSTMPSICAAKMSNENTVTTISNTDKNPVLIGTDVDKNASGVITPRNISGSICSPKDMTNKSTVTCYFMVYIKNDTRAQTDSGAFTGTVTAVGSNGAEVKAQF